MRTRCDGFAGELLAAVIVAAAAALAEEAAKAWWESRQVKAKAKARRRK